MFRIKSSGVLWMALLIISWISHDNLYITCYEALTAEQFTVLVWKDTKKYLMAKQVAFVGTNISHFYKKINQWKLVEVIIRFRVQFGINFH